MLVNGDASLLALHDVILPWMNHLSAMFFSAEKVYTTRHGIGF